jgi:hypothetical protein
MDNSMSSPTVSRRSFSSNFAKGMVAALAGSVFSVTGSARANEISVGSVILNGEGPDCREICNNICCVDPDNAVQCCCINKNYWEDDCMNQCTIECGNDGGIEGILPCTDVPPGPRGVH